MPITVTSQGHPKWSLCNLTVTVAVLDIFYVKKYDLDFDLSRSFKVKSDGSNRKPVGPTYKCSLGWGSNLVYVTVFEIFRVIILTLMIGLTPGAKVHQRGSRPTQVYLPTKFHCPASTRAGDISYKKLEDTITQTQSINQLIIYLFWAVQKNKWMHKTVSHRTQRHEALTGAQN